ncbi:SAM-dependent methlyltransferase [Pseudomonas aeruginosa VRFPA09]|nr:SAM-dependent methlyltransferase [Pseudomonas aeruginosa VRFPA09]
MLICPLCSAALGEVDNGVACPAGHRFDRARQGYLNLLPVQHKKSLDPGDNAAMVEARRQFLGFSPIDWNEAVRVLAPGGGVLRLGPASAHLLELRQRLYDDVRDYADDKHLAGLPAQLRLRHTETLEFRLALDSYDARENLLAMTPHGWRVNPERRARILAEPFEVSVAVRYDWLQRD